MSSLFEPITLGPVSIKNRFVRSATGESMANKDGMVRDSIFGMYEELSAGGVGLIISGHMYVHKDGKCSPAQTGIFDDMHLPGLRKLAEAARGNNTRAIAQLNYAGRKPHDLICSQIEDIRNAFASAAKRAVEAGFDGVQIHAAHGYLLSCFLTPSENERTDSYGGNPAGRRRFLLEVVGAVKEAIGPDKLLCCKLGGIDGWDNSLALEETVESAKALEAAGLHALEISTTLPGEYKHPITKDIDSEEKEGYLLRETEAVKRAVRIPVIQVGGLRTLSVMERMVGQGKCDMISLCRPFIREPGLINAFKNGKSTRAACISCNQCFSVRGTRCVFNKQGE